MTSTNMPQQKADAFSRRHPLTGNVLSFLRSAENKVYTMVVAHTERKDESARLRALQRREADERYARFQFEEANTRAIEADRRQRLAQDYSPMTPSTYYAQLVTRDGGREGDMHMPGGSRRGQQSIWDLS